MNDIVVYDTQPTSLQTTFSFTGRWYDSFIKYIDRKDTTTQGYITCLKVFAVWMVNNGITRPTRDDVLAYREYLRGDHFGKYGADPLKPGTRQQYLRAVKQFFKWTAAEGIYPNIADNIHGEKIRQTHHKDPLPRDAVKKIADGIDTTTETGKRLLTMYLLCITCGLRTVELHRANIEDIKQTGEQTYLFVQGKGHDEKDERVKLTPEVMDAIRDYLNSRTDNPTPKSPLFVATGNKGRPGTKVYKKDKATGEITERISSGRIAPNTIGQLLKALMVKAGYDSDRLTAHSLRHTSNTGAFKASGKNLYVTQLHARHEKPDTTEIYIHDDERDERNTEQQVYDYFFKPDLDTDQRQEAIRLVSMMDPAKLPAVCDFLRAISA